MKKKLLTITAVWLMIALGLTACDGGGSQTADKWETVTDATCTEDGLERRTQNPEETRVIPKLGHDYGEWETITPAGCTVDGSEQRTCARCSGVDMRPVAAHHAVDGSAYDVDAHWSSCSQCEEKLDLTEHHFITEREEKFAYVPDELMRYGHHVARLALGYVDVSRCADCDAVIYDACVVTEHGGRSSHSYSDLGVYPSSLWRQSINTAYIALATGKFNLSLETYSAYATRGAVAIGTRFTIAYDENYNPVRFDGDDGRYYEYDYNDGEIEKITFQSKALQSSSDKPFFNYFELSYDDSGNMTQSVWSMDNYTSTFFAEYEYYADGTLKKITENGTTIAVYDENGLLTEAGSAGLHGVLTIRDATVENGKRTAFTMHFEGDEDAPFNCDVTAAYDENGRLISLISEGEEYGKEHGKETAFTYDEKGRITEVTIISTADGQLSLTKTYKYSYSTDGQITTLTLDTGESSIYYIPLTLSYRRERKLVSE